jgi:hypothetical protein
MGAAEAAISLTRPQLCHPIQPLLGPFQVPQSHPNGTESNLPSPAPHKGQGGKEAAKGQAS